MSATDLIDRLEHCRRTGDGEWVARCPAHNDRSPSLSIRELSDGRTLVHCHAGCGALDVLTSVGLDWGALFPTDDYYAPTSRKKRQQTIDSLTVEIALSDVRSGKKLTDADKQRAREAIMREASR